MAIALEGGGYTGLAASSATKTVTSSAGIPADGDVILIFCTNRDEQAITVSGGFTEIATDADIGIGEEFNVFRRVASSESSDTFTVNYPSNSSSSDHVGLLVFSGVDTTTPEDGITPTTFMGGSSGDVPAIGAANTDGCTKVGVSMAFNGDYSSTGSYSSGTDVVIGARQIGHYVTVDPAAAQSLIDPGATTRSRTGSVSFYLKPAAGGGTFTGSAAVTLAAATSSASGTFATNPSGSGSPTLADATSSASGTFTAPTITGSAAVSLADSTSAGSGTFTAPAFTGSGSPTLADATSSASGTFVPGTITGSGSPTLDDSTSAGSGTFVADTITGSGSPTLDDSTSAGSGTFVAPTVTGSAAASLADATSSASGTFVAPSFTGSAAVTLAAATSSASGTFDFAPTGSASITLAAFTASGTGTLDLSSVVITGSAAITLSELVGAGFGAGTEIDLPTIKARTVSRAGKPYLKITRIIP